MSSSHDDFQDDFQDEEEDIDPSWLLYPEEDTLEADYPYLTEEEIENFYAGGGGADDGADGNIGDPYPYTFWDILEHCVDPTVRGALLHIGKLMVWCLVFRISTQSGDLYKLVINYLQFILF